MSTLITITALSMTAFTIFAGVKAIQAVNQMQMTFEETAREREEQQQQQQENNHESQ